jgi:hypothetical protein
MEGDLMNGYYDRVEAQLRILTERGAHRRSRIPVTPVVAVAASLLVVIAVAGVFVGLRGRAHRSMAPAAPVPVCTSRDWQMRPQTAGRLDEATVAGVSISGSRRCHLRINVAFDLLNRSGALAGAVGAKLDAILPPGVRIERRWAWRNGCEYVPGRYWFRLSGGGKSVRVPVPVPPCIDRRESTGFGLFALPSPNLLSSAGIGPATLGGRFSVTLVRLGYLLGVWGHRVNRGGCGVEWTERMLDGLDLFTGRGLFLGYEYRGRFLATVRGLRVGDPVSRGRQMYGAAFKVSAAQGGSWSAAGLRGYLTTPQNGRIMTIDAGNVGCPAVSP